MIDSPFIPAPITPSDTKKHSRIGIASFVIGIVSMLIFCLAILLAFGYGITIASLNPSIQSLQSSPTILVLGLVLFLSPILGLVGVVLGFVAVFQKNNKKLFAVLGLVFNFLIILVFCVLLVFGLAGQSGAFGL
jgi:hypothetical protein